MHEKTMHSETISNLEKCKKNSINAVAFFALAFFFL